MKIVVKVRVEADLRRMDGETLRAHRQRVYSETQKMVSRAVRTDNRLKIDAVWTDSPLSGKVG